jgi:nitrous oxidase accessory protein
MSRFIFNLFGPRLRWNQVYRPRFMLPSMLLLLAAALLVASYFQPYWKMTLHAPQYPKGLHVQAYLNRLEGDVREIDGLNHYIGMRPLNEAAQLERETSAMMIGVTALLVLAGVLVHSRWAALLAAPAILFPAGFLLDLYWWMNHFGQNLDPHAALSSSIKPFTPPVLGTGMVGQFKTVAGAHTGLIMAAIASAIVLVALVFHRRAYKPLFDARKAQVAARREPVASVVVALLATLLVAGNAAAQSATFDLSQAIALAQPGQVIDIPSGVHRGRVVVDKPLTLVGAKGAIIDGGNDADVFRVIAPDVIIRNLTIRNTGSLLEREHAGVVALAPRLTIEDCVLENVLFGLLLKGAPHSVIRNNTIGGKDVDIGRRGDGIRLWQSAGTLIEGNSVHDGRDVVVWYSSDVTLRRNTVSRCRYGMHFMFTDTNTLEDNTLQDNSVGAFLMYSRDLVVRRNIFARNRGPSGYGLGLKDMDNVVAEDNLFIANRAGAYIDNSPREFNAHDVFTNNTFAYNDIGVACLPNVKRNRFSGNTFMENLQQVAVVGAGSFTGNDFSVDGRGNFWSDYRGYDADRNGVGDLAYRESSLFENLMEREPKLRLMLHSPAQQALDLAARAFPIVQPQPRVMDEYPLMRVTPVRVSLPRPGSRLPMLGAAAGLLALAAIGLLATHSPIRTLRRDEGATS